MSTPIRFGRSSSACDSATRPMVPPTGPESSVCSGRSRALSAVRMPPFDCITWSGTARPRVAHLVLEPPQVAADDGCRVGVEHGRGGALVLAPLARDAVRERDGHVAQLLAQDLRRAQLVGRIDVGEEEGDRHGAETLVAHPLRRRPDRRLVERGRAPRRCRSGARGSRRCRRAGRAARASRSAGRRGGGGRRGRCGRRDQRRPWRAAAHARRGAAGRRSAPASCRAP